MSDEARITELEIKAGFAEDLLDTLNQTVYRQQRELDALRKELIELRRQVSVMSPGDRGAPADEVPPHW
ncbi:SlyX family protein [Derxia lacustris]|uniref:SlyX family protein n=1 Tax=Derxia lacustris TaxID=764842 RepID=UPI000A16D474|nr:SlyX family protein [Derxia lacustris]